MKTGNLLRTYAEISKATNNFRTIKPELLTKDPRRIVVFRLLLGLDQRSMGKLLNKSQGTIWALERGINRQLVRQDAIKIIQTSRKIRQVPTKYELSKKLFEIANRGKFHGAYAKTMAERASTKGAVNSAVRQKPTDQESELINGLETHEIIFQFHGIIKAFRNFVVDFVFPSDENPKTILEMKDLKKNYRKRSMAIELAYKAIKIHEKYPKTKMIAVINGNLQKEALDIIGAEYDKILLNQPLENVIKTIMLSTRASQVKSLS